MMHGQKNIKLYKHLSQSLC